MRFLAPARDAIDPAVFLRPALSAWSEFDTWLRGERWPGVEELNARRPQGMSVRFVAQTRALESENLHYELRIAQRGEIPTREGNWHDLLNALIWLRYPGLKHALNRRQVGEIGVTGPKTRTRAQCALTHFDEAGVVVALRDAALLAAWDAHDWHRLFWLERSAWADGSIEAIVCGHAVLEHALRPAQMLTGKALAVLLPQNINVENAATCVAAAIGEGRTLADPQELRPLPLSGIPGWHDGNTDENFYRTAACFRPLRAGRRYPRALPFDRISA